MSTAIMEAQLRDAIDRDRDLAMRGCRAVSEHPTGVVVEHRGRRVVTWYWRTGGFELSRRGGDAPATKAETIAEAVQLTRAQLCAPE